MYIYLHLYLHLHVDLYLHLHVSEKREGSWNGPGAGSLFRLAPSGIHAKFEAYSAFGGLRVP